MTGGDDRRRSAPDRLAYWQALDSGRILLMAAAAMLVMAAFTGAVALHPRVDWRAALAFGAFIAFGELLQAGAARRPGGRADRDGRRDGLCDAARAARTWSYAVMTRCW